MQAEFRLIDADQPRQAFGGLRQHRDQRQRPQRAIGELVATEALIAVIDPIEANTAIHRHRIQLLDGRRDVATVAIDALPGLAVGLLVTLLEAQEIGGKVGPVRAGIAIIFPTGVGAQLGLGFLTPR